MPRDQFFQFGWRPRAPTLLSKEHEAEIAKHLKDYSKRYDEIDSKLLQEVCRLHSLLPAETMAAISCHMLEAAYYRVHPCVALHGCGEAGFTHSSSQTNCSLATHLVECCFSTTGVTWSIDVLIRIQVVVARCGLGTATSHIALCM